MLLVRKSFSVYCQILLMLSAIIVSLIVSKSFPIVSQNYLSVVGL